VSFVQTPVCTAKSYLRSDRSRALNFSNGSFTNFNCFSARRRSSSVRCSAQEVEQVLLARTEIPAFIPRSDMMEQLIRWATIEANADGAAKFGLPVKIERFYKDDDLWGFDVYFVKDGQNVAKIGVRYDNELVEKYEWVGRGEDGFPQPEGKVENVAGKNFEIW
jgi:hypothetical protein